MVEEYKKVILDFCKTHGGASFAELNRAFAAAGLDYQGDESIMSTDYKNVIIWHNWNHDAIQAFRELPKDEIVVEACSPLIYMLDGIMPDLPIAKRPQSYKHPHWVPCWILLKNPKKEDIIRKGDC